MVVLVLASVVGGQEGAEGEEEEGGLNAAKTTATTDPKCGSN